MNKHLYLIDSTLKEIKAEYNEVHGTSAPVFASSSSSLNGFLFGEQMARTSSCVCNCLELGE